MAQTTAALSWANCVIELSPDGTTWTNVSGFTNSLSVDGGDRQIGEFFTVDGDLPIVTIGKRNRATITIQAVYTEAGSDPYAMAITADGAGAKLYVRWAPKGAGVGNYRFTSGPGLLVSPVWPQGAADSPDAIAIEVQVAVSTITRATISA